MRGSLGEKRFVMLLLQPGVGSLVELLKDGKSEMGGGTQGKEPGPV